MLVTGPSAYPSFGPEAGRTMVGRRRSRFRCKMERVEGVVRGPGWRKGDVVVEGILSLCIGVRVGEGAQMMQEEEFEEFEVGSSVWELEKADTVMINLNNNNIIGI